MQVVRSSTLGAFWKWSHIDGLDVSCERKRSRKMTSQLCLSHQKNKVAICWDAKVVRRAGLGGARTSPLAMLSLRCSLDIQEKCWNCPSPPSLRSRFLGERCYVVREGNIAQVSDPRQVLRTIIAMTSAVCNHHIECWFPKLFQTWTWLPVSLKV